MRTVSREDTVTMEGRCRRAAVEEGEAECAGGREAMEVGVRFNVGGDGSVCRGG